MELRRAVLLFAIVLGIAALVTVVSDGGKRSPRGGQASSPPPASVTRNARLSPSTQAAPNGDPGVASVRIEAGRTPTKASITARRATTVVVATDEPGTVTVPRLGLDEDAEPGAPAMLDVFIDDVGGAPIAVEFTPAGDGASRTIGRLVVRSPRPVR